MIISVSAGTFVCIKITTQHWTTVVFLVLFPSIVTTTFQTCQLSLLSVCLCFRSMVHYPYFKYFVSFQNKTGVSFIHSTECPHQHQTINSLGQWQRAPSTAASSLCWYKVLVEKEVWRLKELLCRTLEIVFKSLSQQYHCLKKRLLLEICRGKLYTNQLLL